MEKAKVITICGSLKFQEKMIEEAERLQLEGNCVLSVTYPSSANIGKLLYNKEQCELVDKLHKQKISMSDSIFVINFNGYIGSSTRSEIEYAKLLGKEIFYLEKKEIESIG